MNKSEQENISKLVQESQRNNRWIMVTSFLNTVVSLVTTLALIWNSLKRSKPSLAVRKKRIILAMAKLNLDLAALDKEAEHEKEITRLEAGLDNENDLDFLSDLKQKGESLLKEKVSKFNKAASEKVDQVTAKLKKEEK